MEHHTTSSNNDSPIPGAAFIITEQTDAPDSERPFWGGDWAARFAAGFAHPPEHADDPATVKLAELVNQAIAALGEIERQIIVDYHVLCLSRRDIGLRRGLTEAEVNNVRQRAERRLKRMLARFVTQRFGPRDRKAGGCPLCVSPDRDKINQVLLDRRPRDPWAVLRREINNRFGLHVTRVQVLMTHCRDHVSSAQKSRTLSCGGTPICPKTFV